MSVQENIKKLEELYEILLSHPIGGTLSTHTHAEYVFTEPHLGLGGVQVHLGIGKIKAVEKLISKLDDIYNQENSWSSHHTYINSLGA